MEIITEETLARLSNAKRVCERLQNAETPDQVDPLVKTIVEFHSCLNALDDALFIMESQAADGEMFLKARARFWRDEIAKLDD